MNHPKGDAGPYVEVPANVNGAEVVKCAMKEIKNVRHPVFSKQRTDPFQDEKDCAEALLEVDPLQQ